MKRFICLITVILLLSGCSADREVEDVLVAVGAGVDCENGKVLLTVEAVDTSGENAQGKIYTSSAESLSEAVADMTALTGKPLYWEHLKFMLISKNAVNQEFENVLYRIMRSKQSRIALPLVITEASSKEILESKPEGHPFVSDLIENELDSSNKCGLTVKSAAYEIYNSLTDGKPIVLPLYKLENEPKINGGMILYPDMHFYPLSEDACLSLGMLSGKVKTGELTSGNVSAGIIKSKVSDKGDLRIVDIYISLRMADGLTENELSEILKKKCADGYALLPEDFISGNEKLKKTPVFNITVRDTGQEKR